MLGRSRSTKVMRREALVLRTLLDSSKLAVLAQNNGGDELKSGSGLGWD